MRNALRKVLAHSLIRMGGVAGLGWLLDASVYFAIAKATGYVFWANMIGNGCGIVFSFAMGSRYVFAYRGVFLYRQFVLYAVFALSLAPLFSGLLAWLVHAGGLALLVAKVAVTVPSFLLNYLLLKWLTQPAIRNEAS